MAQKIYSLYRITNKINGKNYIGQTTCISKRWHDHRKAYNSNKPTQIIHHALIKYGLDNFEFIEIASCLSQEDANNTETILVEQYDSFVKNNGYNATFGGMNAPKSEVWYEAIKKYRENLTEEEKESIRKKQSEATIKQIAEKGHPAQGHKWTDEQKEKLSITQRSLDKEAIYTPEVRQRMSEAHLGYQPPPEQIENMRKGIQAAWDKKNEIRYASGEIKCNAPDCTVAGAAKYRIIDGVRYCTKHGQRMKRNQSLERKPVHLTIGQEPPNKKKFTTEQIEYILTCGKTISAVAREFKVTDKVIKRIRTTSC